MMCISYFLSKYFTFVLILVLQLFTHSVLSLNLTNTYLHHKCLDKEGKYQPGSEFEKELNQMTEAVYTTVRDSKATSYGSAPNVITIIFQCRGDSVGSRCRSCFATAVAGLRRRCERNKAAKIWYDQCFLYISQIDLHSPDRKIDYKNTFSIQNPNIVNGDTKSFNDKTIYFLHKLIKIANTPYSHKVIFYAGGEEKLRANKLYAMVQCLNTISGSCEDCLKSAVKEFSKCCGGKQGAKVYIGMSCNIRYELYPFLSE